MTRYQKFGLCVALIIGLLVLMGTFATGLSKKAIEEKSHLTPTPEEVQKINVETHD